MRQRRFLQPRPRPGEPWLELRHQEGEALALGGKSPMHPGETQHQQLWDFRREALPLWALVSSPVSAPSLEDNWEE